MKFRPRAKANFVACFMQGASKSWSVLERAFRAYQLEHFQWIRKEEVHEKGNSSFPFSSRTVEIYRSAADAENRPTTRITVVFHRKVVVERMVTRRDDTTRGSLSLTSDMVIP